MTGGAAITVNVNAGWHEFIRRIQERARLLGEEPVPAKF
jgi:hypothetical protein